MATKKVAKSSRKAKPSSSPSRAAAGKKTATKKSVQAKGGPLERLGLMELSGKPATIVGADVQVGQAAPDFTAQVGFWPGRDLWQEVAPLAETAGLVRILAAGPSLDTSTCNREMRRFNDEAANLGQDIVIVTLSTDLPVAQKRWCGMAGAERLRVVSDHMAAEFGVRYGALMKERRWLRRSVFVVDRNNVVRYAAYMPKLGDEPDYAAVLAAARQALGAPKR